jgi:hypothetical protein
MANVEVPNASDVASRWTEGASGAGNRFAENAVAASSTWLDRAGSDQAQENFVTAMNDPDVLARRQSNTDDSARQKYERVVGNQGSQRYQQGVQGAEADFQSAIGEVLSSIDGLQIPDRGRPMSQANLDRAREVQRALNEAGGGV